MTLRYSSTCSYLCESDLLCSSVDLHGNSASVISWVISHLLRTAQDACASMGPEPGILTGPLLCLLTVCKVTSLLFQAGGWPWNLPLFLGHSALEEFKMPPTSALLSTMGLGGSCPGHFIPISAQSCGSFHFFHELPHPPDLLKAFPSCPILAAQMVKNLPAMQETQV